MCLRAQSNHSRALLHGLGRVLDLVKAPLWGEDDVIRVVGVAELSMAIQHTDIWRQADRRGLPWWMEEMKVGKER